jgi:hypothetical protein
MPRFLFNQESKGTFHSDLLQDRKKNLPYDANSGVPGPDAGYAADGPGTANC